MMHRPTGHALVAAGPFACVVLLSLGCPKQPPPTQAKVDVKAIDGDALLLEVESNLLSSNPLRVVIESDAEGAAAARMTTTLTLATPDKVRWETTGTFNNQPETIVLVSNGTVMKRLRNGETSEAVTSTGLRRQILVELVRMGALHDVALLAAGGLPDHLGDAESWVVSHDAKVGEVDPTFEPPARPIGYLVSVGGKEAGDCTLHVDIHLRPVQRQMVVHMPKGDMRLKESYVFEAVPADVDYSKP